MPALGLSLGLPFGRVTASGGGTNEVTAYTSPEGFVYDAGSDSESLWLVVSKTASVRYLFYFTYPTSQFPTSSGQSYTNSMAVSMPLNSSASAAAALIYAAALSVGFNVSITDAVVTFTALESGNLLDAAASGDLPAPTITDGS